MQIREFPVLGDDDRDVVDSFAVGLDADAARVLAYLVLRSRSGAGANSPATRLAVRVGTDLGQTQVTTALNGLASAGLVTETTADRSASGRPPKAWQAAGNRPTLAWRIRTTHADALLDRVSDIVSIVGNEVSVETDTKPSTGPVRIALNWTPNGFHAPLLTAAEAGSFEDAGTGASFDVADGSGMALDSIVERDADVAVVGSATLCRALDRGAPVVPVALLYQRAMTVLYTVRETFGEPFTSVEQLRGRTVAMPIGSETGLLGRLFLSQAGVLDDVTIVEVNGEERMALLDERAAAVTGVATDPAPLEDEGYTTDSVLVSEQFPVPGQAIVTHAATLDERAGEVRNVLVGAMDGWVTARQNPTTAAEIVAEWSGEPVVAERRRLDVALERFADSRATREHGWGWQGTDDWRRLLMALGQLECDHEGT